MAPVLERVEVTGSRNKAQLADIDSSMLVDIQSTFATEFEVPERVSLASDGRAVTLALSTQTLAAKQYLRVTPRLEKFAIIMAETARPDGVWPRQVICNCSRRRLRGRHLVEHSARQADRIRVRPRRTVDGRAGRGGRQVGQQRHLRLECLAHGCRRVHRQQPPSQADGPGGDRSVAGQHLGRDQGASRVRARSLPSPPGKNGAAWLPGRARLRRARR
ncbi:DUF4139 domain-containing protein [Massilia sp. H-1]|nr:DUF4139 domain-containing protein [Massilia sp. H-1]